MRHDETTTRIAEFVSDMRGQTLSDAAERAVVRHHLDAIACALGGYATDVAANIRQATSAALVNSGCTVIGLADDVAPEQAVFANSAMVRQLDYNDASPGGGHPSNFIPAAFAAAELAGSTGTQLVSAIHTAYEVYVALASTYPVASAGWDASVFEAVAAAAGAGSLLGLTDDRLADAVAIALVPNMALHCSRYGQVSNWKGLASAHTTMTGMYAARLAAVGISGPAEPFQGRNGLNDRVAPEKASLDLGVRINGLSAVERCNFKYNPAQIGTQTVIGPLAAFGRRHNPADIERIVIVTNRPQWVGTGGGAGDRIARWHPTSRETADHSFPYIAAVSIIDGDVTQESYAPDRLAGSDLRRLMDLTDVVPDDDFTALLPAERKSEVRITLKSGEIVVVECGPPIGHLRNPMTDGQLSKKYRSMASAVLDDKTAERLEQLLWGLSAQTTTHDLRDCYRRVSTAPSRLA